MVAGATPKEEDPIVVTGLGLSTSLGFGAKVNWERMLGGHSAIAVQPKELFPLPVSLPVLSIGVHHEFLTADFQTSLRPL